MLLIGHALPLQLARLTSQKPRRGRATRGGTGTTAGGGASDAIAIEARELVWRAVGDAAGLTVKGQVRRAAENLGYEPEDWRVREAWYGRAESWSAAAVDDLRRRYAAWRETAAHHGPKGEQESPALAQRVRAIAAALEQLQHQVGEIAAEVEDLSRDGSTQR